MGINKRGNEVLETLERKQIDYKKVMIRLKEDESVRVRILTDKDYVSYTAHGSFNKGIYTQPCRDENCPFCLANRVGGEEFEDLKMSEKFMFAMADIDMGEIRFWTASKKQAKALIAQIKEYKDDLGEFAFNFKRTGNGTSTTYSLNLIPRLKKEDTALFKKFDEVTVDDSMFEAVCTPKSEKLMVSLLKEAGFPVEKHFSAELCAVDEVIAIENNEIEHF